MISFIGAGKVGTSLGIYFRENGLNVGGYFSRSLHSAEKAAEVTSSKTYQELQSLVNENSIIWVTTPDDSTEQVAKQISNLDIKDGKTFVHSSGLLTSEIFNCLKEKGHQICSVHPLLAFSEIPIAVKMLKKTSFFLEGAEDDLAQIKQILDKTGNPYFTIDKKNKPAYHAAACVLSNYMVTLVNASNQIFELAGISDEKLSGATSVLLESVVENIHKQKPKDALTGPIKRGDIQTVKKHIEILEENLPELADLYKILGKETERMLGRPTSDFFE